MEKSKYRRLLLTSCLLTNIILSGCTKANMNEQIYFKDIADVTTEKYYSIVSNNKRFFIRKSELLSKLSYDNYQDILLKVNEKGNTIISEDIKSYDYILNCKKTYDYDKNEDIVYVSSKNDASVYVELVNGYRIKYNGKTYDIAKEDLINLYNEKSLKIYNNGKKLVFNSTDGFAFVEDLNGDKDHILVLK